MSYLADSADNDDIIEMDPMGVIVKMTAIIYLKVKSYLQY